MKHARLIMLAVLLGVLVGTIPSCSPWATYPKTKGEFNVGGSGTEPIPTLMTESIRYAHDRWGGTSEPVINLPAGTPASVYDTVIKRLGKGRWMTQVGEKVFEIREIRVRGFDAEVDMVHPSGESLYQFTTISFKRDSDTKFRTTTARLWRIHVEPGTPNYVPPPVKASKAAPADQPK